MENVQRQSILDMARGAIKERTDYEMAKILDNILAPIPRPQKSGRSPLRWNLYRTATVCRLASG